MAKNDKRTRSTLRDPADYDGMALQDLLENLSTVILTFNETADKLKKLKQKIKRHKKVFDDPEEIIDLLYHYNSLFSEFHCDLERVIQEAPSGIKERHLECISQIVERYRYERDSVRHFIKELFDCGLKNKNDCPSIVLEIVDEMRLVLYSQLVYVRGDLSGINRRMKVFVGLKPPGIEPVVAKAILTFPVDPGTKWQQVSIRFQSSKVVELKIGNKHRGNEFQEIGFEDKRTGKYTKAWLILANLGQFRAVNRETLGFYEIFATNQNLTKQIQGLNRILQSIFKIEGSERAIVFDRKTDCYCANIQVSLFDSEILDEIWASFRPYSLPKGTPEDLCEMKSHRKK